MTRRWEAEHRGGGRFVLRRHRRYGHLVVVAVVAVAGGGAATRMCGRLGGWLRGVAHVDAGPVAVALLVGAALLWLWHRAGRRRGSPRRPRRR